jgi:hypothetical protein
MRGLSTGHSQRWVCRCKLKGWRAPAQTSRLWRLPTPMTPMVVPRSDEDAKPRTIKGRAIVVGVHMSAATMPVPVMPPAAAPPVHVLNLRVLAGRCTEASHSTWWCRSRRDRHEAQSDHPSDREPIRIAHFCFLLGVRRVIPRRYLQLINELPEQHLNARGRGRCVSASTGGRMSLRHAVWPGIDNVFDATE